jgi:Cof subfamily protein (haloacid dehalogenase superfamily)
MTQRAFTASPFRVIALDLDGTLLDEGMRILPDNVAALQAARARGIEVVLVTGRHHIAARAYHEQLALDTPAVCCNGIYLHDYASDTPVRGEPLPVADRLALLARVRRDGLHALAYLGDRFCFETGEPVLDEVMAWAETLPEPLRPRFERVDDLAPVLAQAPRVWKMAISHHDPAALPAFARGVEAELGLGTVQTGPLRLDIGRPGHSKASGLLHWLASRGVAADQVVAFGDNHNDISMLEAVGHGVAMAGAPAAVQASADEVCGSNDEPSIAAVLQRLQAEGRLG